MADNALTANRGAVFLQADGPNTKPLYIGCVDVGDLSIPEGGIELLRCFTVDGESWKVVGETKTAPDNVSVSLTELMYKARGYIEKLKCSFTLYLLISDCGDKNVFSNFQTGYILKNMRRTNTTVSAFAMREEDAPITKAFDLEGWEAVLVDELEVQRVSQTTTYAFNDIWMNSNTRCAGSCGAAVDPGDFGVAVTDADVAANGEVYLTVDGGVTWTQTAADPAGNAENLVAVTMFYVDRNTRRILVGLEAPAGAQGEVYYSDDSGATWSTVNIGGAAAGHGATYGKGLFAASQSFVFLAGAAGYIYKSEDGGETWTAVEQGVITSGDYTSIHFYDDKYGVAVAAAGIVSVTTDGGESWAQATTIAAGAAGNLCCARVDQDVLWVGDDAGKLWYSNDGGTTWTQRTGWTGSGVGDVRSMSWFDNHVGLILSDTAAPVGTVLYTIDGGYTWMSITTPTNAGLNSVYVVDTGLAFAVGEVSGGTGVLLRIDPVYE